MQKLKNEWLRVNKNKVSEVQRILVEKSYQGAPQGDLNLAIVNNLLGGAVLEITKLQNKVDELNEKIKKLEVKDVKP